VPGQDAVEEAVRDEIADLEAFEARFPADAFEAAAEVLGIAEDPEAQARLRYCLLPEFRFFLANCSGEKLTREERMKRLKFLRDAATALQVSLGPGGARLLLPRKFLGPELLSDQFRATLRSLADEADKQLLRLRSSRGKSGRPPKDAIRQLGKDLIRVFRNVKDEADELNWENFHRFASAACHCLRSRFPEVNGEFPKTPRDMRETLREVWNSEVLGKTKKPSGRKPNLSA
jgi:hypothetical protein